MYVGCNYACHSQMSNSWKVVVDYMTTNAPKCLDYVPNDIECFDVGDSYAKENNVVIYYDHYNVDFGKLILKDFYDHVVYAC